MYTWLCGIYVWGFMDTCVILKARGPPGALQSGTVHFLLREGFWLVLNLRTRLDCLAWTHTYFCFPSSRITNVATTPGFVKMWGLGNKLRFSLEALYWQGITLYSLGILLACFSTRERIYSWKPLIQFLSSMLLSSPSGTGNNYSHKICDLIKY